MTSDQIYSLIKLGLVLGFAAFILWGVYRVMVRDDNRPDGDD